MNHLHAIRLSSRGGARGALMFLALGGALGGAACEKRPEGQGVGSIDREIIGGFAANDPALDAIGSLVIHFETPPFGSPGAPGEELCGATLIAKETVLTAKHCARIVPLIASLGGRLTFAVGPSSTSPKREVNIAAFETAPGDDGGFVGYGHDVAVMHLESAITDLAYVDLGLLGDEQVAKAFAAIGYGIQDNGGTFGTRRLGKQTLRSVRGLIFETMFGNFENFLEWFKNGTAPQASDADGGRPKGDGGFPQPPSIEEIARMYYDNTKLDEGYEVVTGGAPGDAQPCFGDSGSSLIRRQDGKFVSYGVVSGGLGTRDSICDLGTVYATFGPGVLEFVQSSRDWVDPCGDLDTTGTCDGETAVRCTSLAEGRRRLVSFDCSSLEMKCTTATGQVSCDGNAFAPPPPNPPPPGGSKSDPRKQADRVFMTPSSLTAPRR
jgi:hypothetical protein